MLGLHKSGHMYMYMYVHVYKYINTLHQFYVQGRDIEVFLTLEYQNTASPVLSERGNEKQNSYHIPTHNLHVYPYMYIVRTQNIHAYIQ